jgi:hypothetical protein
MGMAGLARVWIRRAALALVCAGLLLQLWFFGWVMFWKWHNPGLTAFMRYDIERLERSVSPPRPGQGPRPAACYSAPGSTTRTCHRI